MKNNTSQQHISLNQDIYATIDQEGPDVFVLSVGSGSVSDRNAASIQLTREKLKALGYEAFDHVNGCHQRQKDKSEVLDAAQEYAAQTQRTRALEMARSTPGLKGSREVLEAATAYYEYIVGNDPLKQDKDWI